jgi:prevent-host-death family protein
MATRETVSAAEANRQFSRLLREVKQGKTYVITSHGRPVARIAPPEEPEQASEAAWQSLLDHLSNQNVTNDAGPWTRDELYEDVL